MQPAATLPALPPPVAEAPSRELAVSIFMPPTPGFPADNVFGFEVLARFLKHRLDEQGLLVGAFSLAGLANDSLGFFNVRDVRAAVDVIKEVVGPVLIHFTEIAYYDEREGCFRHVWPAKPSSPMAPLRLRARLVVLQRHVNRLRQWHVARQRLIRQLRSPAPNLP